MSLIVCKCILNVRVYKCMFVCLLLLLLFVCLLLLLLLFVSLFVSFWGGGGLDETNAKSGNKK